MSPNTKLDDKPVRFVSMLRTVAPSSSHARVFERRITFVAVVTPFIGLLAAVFLLWRTGVGPTELWLLGIMYAVSLIGIGVGFHRYLTHRAFETTRVVRIVLAIMGSVAAQGPVLFWVALHRRHHATSDREGDPHSPHLHGEGVKNFLRGFWHAHTGWLFVHEVHDWSILAPDLIRDRTLFRINRLYFLWVMSGLAIPGAVEGIITGTWQGVAKGILWGGLVRICLGHHTTWSVNSICHIVGTRPFRTNDRSVNNFWLAIPSFGESWHNNHHAFPNSAFHGLRWWQIDLSGYLIRLLQLTGLAWNVKAPSEIRIQELSTKKRPVREERKFRARTGETI
jgi:stearoyl-CoA desaturase (delta-9 desaturase)